MSIDAAHTRWWQIGEVVFGVPLLVAVALQRAAPLSFIDSSFTPTFWVLGGVLCAAGISLIAVTRRVLSKFHQPTDPGLPTRSVVTSGIFAVSRNPLYLGAACSTLGIALIFELSWVFILFIPTLIVCHVVLIEPEERYLTAKFGAECASYAASVRRWLGRKLL